MFKNYLKISFRNLIREKVYTLIIIIGLSISIVSFLLIVLYIQNELSYDKHIPDADRLYRCVELQHAEGVGDQHVAVTMGPLAEALVNDFPEVEKAVRLLAWGSFPIEYNGKQFNEDFIVFTDPEIFELFNVQLIRGDTSSALDELKSIIVSEKVAKKFFNSVDEAVGKIVTFYNKEGFLITGVMKDQPENAHFKMEVLIPFKYIESQFSWLKGWGSNSLDTYIRLAKGTDYHELEEKFEEFLLKYIDIPEEDRHRMFQLYLQPVLDIHLKSDKMKFQVMNYNQGSITLIYVFSIVAILIIIIACINFINIAISRSVKRSKEVGIRKVLGANRRNLIYQFLGESFIITFISILFALVLVEFLLPSFNQILDTSLEIDFINNWIFNFGLLAILLIVSFFSGAYPAFYLSRFHPIKILKNTSSLRNTKSGILSKILVVFQFVISISLIFCIMIIYTQFNYILNKDLGYNYNDVVSIPLFNNNTPEKIEQIKNELRQNPNIINISVGSSVSGASGTQATITVDDTAQSRITSRICCVDYNFFQMMEIPVIKGRNFSKEYALDENEAVILNESAVHYLGWDDPIGKVFKPMLLDTVTKKRVIGVIQDYHYYSLHSKIEPAVYIIDNERNRTLCIKLNKSTIKETVEFIESKWNELFPGVPFEMVFANEQLREYYEDEENTMKLFTFFTLLSIIISCLGLYGLISYIVEQRTKEIGIRKVLGSKTSQIVSLLTKNFIKLVLIAGIIASPIAWYFMDKALQNFAYRINISWYYFVIAIVVALIIAILTILYHALKTANKNPVDALKYE